MARYNGFIRSILAVPSGTKKVIKKTSFESTGYSMITGIKNRRIIGKSFFMDRDVPNGKRRRLIKTGIGVPVDVRYIETIREIDDKTRITPRTYRWR